MTNEELKNLNEAPASMNFYAISNQGWNIQFTLRDVDEFTLLERFAQFVGVLNEYKMTPKAVGAQKVASPQPEPQPDYPFPQAENQTPEDYCAKHGVQMKQWEKDGKVWYSHKTDDGQWCKGK